MTRELYLEDREAIGSAPLHLGAGNRRHDGGWRIGRRVISPQRTPVGGAGPH
jgi:hypothetical protein